MNDMHFKTFKNLFLICKIPQNAKRFTLNILDSGMLNLDAFIQRP